MGETGRYGEVVQVAGVVGVVDAAQEEHAARRLLRVLAHPKGEERRRELALLDQLLHHRREAVDLLTAAGVNSVSSQCCMAGVRQWTESDG